MPKVTRPTPGPREPTGAQRTCRGTHLRQPVSSVSPGACRHLDSIPNTAAGQRTLSRSQAMCKMHKVQQEKCCGVSGWGSSRPTSLLLCVVITNASKWHVLSWMPENMGSLWVYIFWMILIRLPAVYTLITHFMWWKCIYAFNTEGFSFTFLSSRQYQLHSGICTRRYKCYKYV